MRSTDHQLAEGVCESIATTTPGFRPPSKATRHMRAAIAWVVAAAFVLFLYALKQGTGA